jgi:hypothetical protein
VVKPASTQTLPRVTTYHAALQRLIFEPLPELTGLRGAPLFSGAPSLPAGGAVVPLSAGWARGAGNSSEARLTFALPPTSASFAVRVWGDRAAPGSFHDLVFAFDATAFTASVAWVAAGGPPAGAADVPLLRGDTAVDVALFIDNTFAEAFVMEGRVALTLALDGVADAALGLYANGTAIDAIADVWPLAPIWTTAPTVLAARR